MIIKFRQIILLLIVAPVFAVGQSTFNSVYTLLQTNCNGSGCHDGVTPIFSVMGTESDVYNALVNQSPINPEAVLKGDKLVDPGIPQRSFLLRKMAHGMNPYLAIDLNEGDPMPATKLNDVDIELMRQWILNGAPNTGTVVNLALINDYYNNGGIDGTYPVHDAPAPGEGFQIYLGKIFVPANTEEEFFIKYDPKLTGNLEIPRVQTMLPAATHHFVVYKFLPGEHVNYRQGLRGLDDGSHSGVSDGIGTGKNVWNYELPSGLAYFWSQDTYLDFNLHIRNDNSKVLGADLYVNIYTQPIGTATNFMLVRNFPYFDISIPHDNNIHTFTVTANDTNETKMWRIWQLYSHTHRYGKDYDIWKRNPDGTKGLQVYEGFCNYEAGTPTNPCVNAGYYRWGVDVTFRYFEPFLEIDPRLGLIHEATYLNNAGPDPVEFGVTSLDEMMVMGFQFSYGDDLGALATVGINEATESNFKFKSFPNPFNNEVNLQYLVSRESWVKMELFNVLGEKLQTIVDESKQAGNYFQTLYTQELNPGVYVVNLSVDQNSAIRKIIKVE